MWYPAVVFSLPTLPWVSRLLHSTLGLAGNHKTANASWLLGFHNTNQSKAVFPPKLCFQNTDESKARREKVLRGKGMPVLHRGGKLLLVSAAKCILNTMDGEWLDFSWVLCLGAKGVIALMPAASTPPMQPCNKRWSRGGIFIRGRLTLQKALQGQETHGSQIRKGKGEEGEKHNRKGLYSPDFMSPCGFCCRETGILFGMHNFDLCPIHRLVFPSR